MFGQPENSKARAEALFRMGFAVEDMGDEFFDVGAGLGRPADDP